MPVILKDLNQPRDNILIHKDKVAVYWEKDCLGQGTLFLTENNLFWIQESSNKGFSMNYLAVGVHAISSSNDDFSDPCLFTMIDIGKTDIEYVKEETNIDEADQDEEVKSTTVRFVPTDSVALNELYTQMNKCQVMNPDPDDELVSGNVSDDELGQSLSQNGNCGVDEESGHTWFTSNTATDEIHLSPEGRARIERILGNIGEDTVSPPNFEEDVQEEMDQ